MRNAVTEASEWWAALPCITAGALCVCSAVYAVSLLLGYDSFTQVCLLPDHIVGHLQVYRPYTSLLFHASILHLAFTMLALVPIGSGLERLLGSVRYLHVLFLMATSNALLQVGLAYLWAYNPLLPYRGLLSECGLGFSGVIFALIIIETSLNSVQTRSIFGVFTVPAHWHLLSRDLVSLWEAAAHSHLLDGLLYAKRFPGRGQVLRSSVAAPPPAPGADFSGSAGGWRPKPSSNQTELQARLLDVSFPLPPPPLQQIPLTTVLPHIRSGLQQLSHPLDNPHTEPPISVCKVAST